MGYSFTPISASPYVVGEIKHSRFTLGTGWLLQDGSTYNVDDYPDLGALYGGTVTMLAVNLKKFGIGEPTGLNFPGEANGFVPAHADWSATSMPTIAFGQGLSVNAVQSASVFATIAKDTPGEQARLGVRMFAMFIAAAVVLGWAIASTILPLWRTVKSFGAVVRS